MKAWRIAPVFAVLCLDALSVAEPERRDLSLGRGVVLTLVRIPPGTFRMGSPPTEIGRLPNEDLPTTVTITHPFRMAETETTVAQFARFVEATRYRTEAEISGGAYSMLGETWKSSRDATWKSPGYQQGPDSPVTCVSWNDATAFCRWASDTTGTTITLPTEAQWEYACRAGTSTAFQWGDDPEQGNGWANGADSTAAGHFHGWLGATWDDKMIFPGPVRSFRPNAFGLYDMHGNVFEWCEDYFERTLPGGTVPDRHGPAIGTDRCIRGGGWIYPVTWMRSAFRGQHTPDVRAASLGFRVIASEN